MIKWGTDISVPRAYQLAEESSAAITELLRNGTVEGASKPLLASAASAVTLANEKVYVPFLLIQKKNYAAMKYTLKGKHQPLALEDFDCSMDLKGIDAVRRDRSKLIKALSMDVLDALLVQGSLEAAFAKLREALELVASHKAPLEWFILSKSLKSTYKTENQPHVQAWKRMQDRGESDIPEIGTRMPYVIVASSNTSKAGPLYERTEHPDFVRRTNKKVCAKYYLENAQDVIERLLGPTQQVHKVKSMFSDAIAKAGASGTLDLRSFFKRTKTS
jgi:DNA polymerase elongation subunit (family B)